MSSFNEQEYQRVFNSMEHERVDGISVSDESEQFEYRQLLVELAAKSRIPTIYAYRQHVELGGLMAYSFDADDLARGNACTRCNPRGLGRWQSVVSCQRDDHVNRNNERYVGR